MNRDALIERIAQYLWDLYPDCGLIDLKREAVELVEAVIRLATVETLKELGARERAAEDENRE